MAFNRMQHRTAEPRMADDTRRPQGASDRALVAAVGKDLARRGHKAPRLARGRVLVTPDIRKGRPNLNDMIVKACPKALPDRMFDLVLFGERADLFERSVMKALAARRGGAAGAARVEVEIEGYWHTRWWKDRHGAWRNAKEFSVARWALVDGHSMPRKPIGWLPKAFSVVAA